MRRTVFEPGPGKWDQDYALDLNVRRVLTFIAANPWQTAADTGRAIGLSAATVSRLIEHLLLRELIVEGPRVRGKRGQPGVSLQMNPTGAYSVGCQIGFGQCYVKLRSLGGQVLNEREFAIESCAVPHVVERVKNAIENLLSSQSNEVSERVIGIGIACPVDFQRLFGATVGDIQDVGIWDERAFQVAIEQEIRLSVFTYATGSAAAWAELAVLPRPRPADYLYLFLDRFVQSGLFMNGRLWVGPSQRSGNIGRANVMHHGDSFRTYDLAQLPLGQASSIASAGSRTDEWLASMAGVLSPTIQVLCDTLDLPLVVIDGNLSESRLDGLVEELAAILPRLTWGSAPHVQRGSAGQRAPAKGAALLPMYDKFFSDGTT